MSGRSHPLRDRVALVTGAASGIGRAVARRLAADGATVGCLDLLPTGLELTVRAIEGDGGRAVMLPCDVTDPRRVDDAVAELTRAVGKPLVLVNCAGIPG
jgi:NAD(P)-dependent dehydrogenase (short-subunit alcohol dehydrogenase family)